MKVELIYQKYTLINVKKNYEKNFINYFFNFDAKNFIC